MGKKLGKREVLDLILAEVTKLRGEVKALEKQLAAKADRTAAPGGGAAPAKRAKPAKSANKTAPGKKASPQRGPVLVQSAPGTDTTAARSQG